MSPGSQTIYSIGLFLALIALLVWSRRRNRVAVNFRRRVVSALTPTDHAESE
jgi:hypothetical protein